MKFKEELKYHLKEERSSGYQKSRWVRNYSTSCSSSRYFHLQSSILWLYWKGLTRKRKISVWSLREQREKSVTIRSRLSGNTFLYVLRFSFTRSNKFRSLKKRSRSVGDKDLLCKGRGVPCRVEKWTVERRPDELYHQRSRF